MMNANEFFKDKKVVALAKAIHKGDREKIKALIREGVDPNSIGKDGTSLLFWAIMVDSTKGFDFLLQEGADPTLCDKDGRTMLHIAAMAGNSEFLKILLDHGVDPNIRSCLDNNTALYDVSGLNQKNFDLLIEAGTDLNATDNTGGTILHNAAGSGTTTHFLIQLLKLGADPKIKTKKGHTFQAYFFMTDENIMTIEGKEERQWVRNWLNDHNIPLEEK